MTTRRVQPRRRRGCLGTIVVLVWVAVAVVIAYILLIRPYVSAYIGDQLAERFGGPDAGVGLPAGSEAALPTIVAALPPGQFTVTEGQANDYLQTNATGVSQVESVQVHFVPGQIQADVRAAGTNNRVTLGLAVTNGKIVVVDPRINGPLEAFVAPEQLVAGLTTRLNNELAAQGKPPTEVRIEEGQIVVVLGNA